MNNKKRNVKTELQVKKKKISKKKIVEKNNTIAKK